MHGIMKLHSLPDGLRVWANCETVRKPRGASGRSRPERLSYHVPDTPVVWTACGPRDQRQLCVTGTQQRRYAGRPSMFSKFCSNRTATSQTKEFGGAESNLNRTSRTSNHTPGEHGPSR